MNESVFTINYGTLAGCIFLCIFLYDNFLLEPGIKKVFYALVELELLEMVVYSLELWTATFTEPTYFRILLSAVGYSVRPMIIFLIFVLSLRDVPGKKPWLVLSIPLIFNVIVAFSAFVSPIAYSYDAHNNFVRGPLGYTTHIVLFFYLFCILRTTIKEFRFRQHLESVLILVSMVMIVSNIVIETKYGLRSGRIAIALSTIFYYMFFQTQIYKTNMDNNHKIRKGLEQQSKIDPLTGLLNKQSFYKEVSQRIRSGHNESMALIFLDLDHFKEVNDSLGHLSGDKAIQEAASTLQGIYRQTDLIGRFGGDEFLVFIQNIPYEILQDRLEESVEKLRTQYSNHINTVNITSSMGAIYAESGEHVDLHQMVSMVDSILYEAKRNGRNQYISKKYSAVMNF